MTFLSFLKLAGLILGGIWAYLVIGALFVVIGATVSKLKGGDWFCKTRPGYESNWTRWGSAKTFSPVFVFFAWPLFVMLAPPLAAFLSLGGATEGAANRIFSLIEKRRETVAKLKPPQATK